MFIPSYIVSIYNDDNQPIYFEFANEFSAIEYAKKMISWGFQVRLYQQIPIVK